MSSGVEEMWYLFATSEVLELNVCMLIPWMYYEDWILDENMMPIHSYDVFACESCSVMHTPKNIGFLTDSLLRNV